MLLFLVFDVLERNAKLMGNIVDDISKASSRQRYGQVLGSLVRYGKKRIPFSIRFLSAYFSYFRSKSLKKKADWDNGYSEFSFFRKIRLAKVFIDPKNDDLCINKTSFIYFGQNQKIIDKIALQTDPFSKLLQKIEFSPPISCDSLVFHTHGNMSCYQNLYFFEAL